jgi:hypothetical protein
MLDVEGKLMLCYSDACWYSYNKTGGEMAYSLLQLDTLQKIVLAVECLERLCDDAKQLLMQANPVQCRIYQIPRTVRENESQPVTDIHPTDLSGTEAFHAALHAMTDWYGHPQYSTKVVNRVPGALVLTNVDESQVLDRMAEINRSKTTIESLIPSLGSRDDRFELLHRHFPWLILAHLTRRLRIRYAKGWNHFGNARAQRLTTFPGTSRLIEKLWPFAHCQHPHNCGRAAYFVFAR